MARRTAIEQRIEELKALQAARAAGSAPAIVKTRAPLAPPAAPGSRTRAALLHLVQLAANDEGASTADVERVKAARDDALATVKELRSERLAFELEISSLREQVESLERDATADRERIAELEKEAEEAATEKEELEGRLDPDKMAARFHEWLRDNRLVAERHDYPLHCTDSVYRTSLEAAAEWAVQ